MWTWLILTLLILISAKDAVLLYAAYKDFASRKFKDPATRGKWRWIISFVPFGYLFYLKKYYNMPKDFSQESHPVSASVWWLGLSGDCYPDTA